MNNRAPELLNNIPVDTLTSKGISNPFRFSPLFSFPQLFSSLALLSTMFLFGLPFRHYVSLLFTTIFLLWGSFSLPFSSSGLLFATIFLFGAPFRHHFLIRASFLPLFFHLRASFSQLFSSSGLLVATIVSSSGPLFATSFLSHLKFCISPICFSKRPCQTLREKILLSSPHES